MFHGLKKLVRPEKEETHCGKRLCFHGRFADKQIAVAREKQVKNSFIIEREIRGDTYFLVVTEKK